jgi:FkbM family methyltransferase
VPIVKLDYKGADLSIENNTPIEQAYRICAASKEPWTVDFIESIPKGAVFWDIGACVGGYTMIALSRGLNVVAVEPAFQNYATLCRNLAMNSMLDKGINLCAALGPADGWVWLHLQDARSGSGGHSLNGSARKSSLHKVLVKSIAWDTLLDWLPWSGDLPHYAKIDVEGGEATILQGAPRMLQLLRSLIVEMPLTVEKDITDTLQAAGLRLAQRFDQRADKQIVGVAYGRFERG